MAKLEAGNPIVAVTPNHDTSNGEFVVQEQFQRLDRKETVDSSKDGSGHLYGPSPVVAKDSPVADQANVTLPERLNPPNGVHRIQQSSNQASVTQTLENGGTEASVHISENSDMAAQLSSGQVVGSSQANDQVHDSCVAADNNLSTATKESGNTAVAVKPAAQYTQSFMQTSTDTMVEATTQTNTQTTTDSSTQTQLDAEASSLFANQVLACVMAIVPNSAAGISRRNMVSTRNKQLGGYVQKTYHAKHHLKLAAKAIYNFLEIPPRFSFSSTYTCTQSTLKH